MSAATEATTPRYGPIWAAGVLILGGLAALLWLEPPWLQRLQAACFDVYQVVAPRRVESMPATIVEIDEASLARFGQWPWPRNMLAELLRSIERRGPAAIGIDILMPEVDRLSPHRALEQFRRADPVLADRLAALPSTDTELARALAAGPVVLGAAGTSETTTTTLRAPPVAVVETSPRETATIVSALKLTHYRGAVTSIDELDRAARGHGLISIEPSNGVVRRIALVADVNGTLVPAFSVELLRVALGAPAFRLIAAGPAVRGISVGDLVVPTEDDGAIRIYYSHRDARRYVSAFDVLEGRADPARFERKLVVVGTTAIGLGDLPISPLGESMPGSEIQVQLLENIYDQTWLTRPSWARAAELLAFGLCGLLLVWATPRWTPRNAALAASGCIGLFVVVAYAAFHSLRLLFDAATPGLSLFLLFCLLLVLTLAEAMRRRKALERVIQAQREEAAYIEGELAAARRIQMGILPRADLVREDERIELAATMEPAREVGGDLYDFFRLDERRLFFLIGDVAGKGLSASIFMAVSKALYKSTALRAPEAAIGELMRVANEEVSRDNPEMFFVTAFAGVLDLESGDLAYCNAGHENPFLLDAGRSVPARLEQGGGPPLCVVDDFEYRGAMHRMRPGELLCLVTDGVLDARNAAGERYGGGRLHELLRSLSDAPTARSVVESITCDVAAFVRGAEPSDDLTVLAVRWAGRPAAH